MAGEVFSLRRDIQTNPLEGCKSSLTDFVSMSLESMLLQLTIFANLIELGSSLWLGFYLFNRGYPNRITARVALSLVALSAFFLGAFNNHFFPAPELAFLRAILLVISMGCWYSVVFHLLPAKHKAAFRWLEYAVYAFCGASIFLLITNPNVFGASVATTYSAPLQRGLTYNVYGFTLIFTPVITAVTAWRNQRIHATKDSLYVFLTSLFPLFTVIYKVIAELINPQIMPRIIQDGLFFVGVFSMGIAVARHQSMLERRTILQEFPTTALFVFLASVGYGTIGWAAGLPFSVMGNVVAVIVSSFGLYDFIREALERRRSWEREEFRRKLRVTDSAGEDKLKKMLQDGLDLLCEVLHASSGIVAIQEGRKARVVASRNSVEVGSEFVPEAKEDEAQYRSERTIPNIQWFSSIFEGGRQIALAGVGASLAKMEYSSGDLELLDEFANHVGMLVMLANLVTDNQVLGAPEEGGGGQVELAAENMMRTLSSPQETELIALVEDAMRKFSDSLVLGQSALVEIVGIESNTLVERGRQLQEVLRQAVEALRPASVRPVDVIPPAWYAYIILHDAYLEGARNRDVMARLYISEGTFNRTRRLALRGAARWLIEKFGGEGKLSKV